MSIDTPDAGVAASSQPVEDHVATAEPAGPPVYRLTVTQVTSYLVLTSRKARSFVGTPEQLKAEYRKVRRHNLLLGWWGIPAGLIWTPRSLARNAKALEQLEQISAPGGGAQAAA